MAGRKHWTVTLSGSRSFATVRKELEAAGFKVDHAMEAIGVVTGSCAEATVAKLRRLQGVEDISPEGTIDIGPPDSPSTW